MKSIKKIIVLLIFALLICGCNNEEIEEKSRIITIRIFEYGEYIGHAYGYIEKINVDEFIDRTTFEAYEKMPLFLSFGFAFGAFEKNTIFFVN